MGYDVHVIAPEPDCKPEDGERNNTSISFDPRMPWHDPTKPYVNYWFSSSDGHDVKLFNDIPAPKNIDKLEEEGGACFIYTHYASGLLID